MSIPQQAVNLIKQFEGFRANAYPDPIHKWAIPTIGYGTTIYSNGNRVKAKDVITQWEAELELVHFLEKQIQPKLAKIPNWKLMDENQRSALYSFAYNLGANFYQNKGFASITKLIDSIPLWRDTNFVKETFSKYCNPGTTSEHGLRRRRIAEAELFLSSSPLTQTIGGH